MSDESAILVCPQYFLDCLQPYLTTTKETKDAENDLAASVFIRDLSAKNNFV